MARQPSVPLRLVGLEIIEHDVDLAVRVIGHDLVHEVEELDPPPAPIVSCLDLARGNVEGGEEGRRAVPLVVVAVARERAAVRQPEIALRPLERLDVRLLVDCEHERALRRVEVEADDLGRLGHEVGIVADAPRLLAVEVDLLGPQEAPDILIADVAQSPVATSPPVQRA